MSKYPVLTLPPEIVSEIFTHLLPVYPLRPPTSVLRSPTILSHICSRWREIALTTLALWRAISIELIPDDECLRPQPGYLESLLHILETWLARSQSCALSIALVDWVYVSVTAPFVRAIIARCNKWEHVDLHVTPDLVPLFNGDMPLLRSLRFTLQEAYPDHRTPSIFQHAPLLCAATSFTSFPSELVLPWAQFTRLSLECVRQDSCSQLLRQMPNLVHCRLQFVGSSCVLSP
ncbi:hypothetical protein DFH07DRAFT_794099 [Mycena maculata]|uniref:F-box domain-containing protein n=1 Tax=Mycena maculata TaxID=230809 RepID=A0AAD7NXT3_9AGAR|nr:hypothetical protein DFH07DRAFT_794099 [Mycena maculata]